MMIAWHPAFEDLPADLQPLGKQFAQGMRLPAKGEELNDVLSSLVGVVASSSGATGLRWLTKRGDAGRHVGERKAGRVEWKGALKAWLQAVAVKEAVVHADRDTRAKVIELCAALTFMIEPTAPQLPRPGVGGSDGEGEVGSNAYARFAAWHQRHRAHFPSGEKQDRYFRMLDRLLWHRLSVALGRGTEVANEWGRYLLHDIGRAVAGLLVAVDVDTHQIAGIPHVRCAGHGEPVAHPALALRLASLEPLADSGQRAEVERYAEICRAHAGRLALLLERPAPLAPGPPVSWGCCTQRYQVRIIPDWVREHLEHGRAEARRMSASMAADVQEREKPLPPDPGPMAQVWIYFGSIRSRETALAEEALRNVMAGVESARSPAPAATSVTGDDDLSLYLGACDEAVPLEGLAGLWSDVRPGPTAYTGVAPLERWVRHPDRGPATVRDNPDLPVADPQGLSPEDEVLQEQERETRRALSALAIDMLWFGKTPSEQATQKKTKRIRDQPLRQLAVRVTHRHLAGRDAGWWDDLLIDGIARGVRAFRDDWDATRYFYRKRLQNSDVLTIARSMCPAARFDDALEAMMPASEFGREDARRAGRDWKSEKHNEDVQIGRGRATVELTVVSPTNLIEDLYFEVVYRLANLQPGLVGNLLYRAHEAGGLESSAGLNVVEEFLERSRDVSIVIDRQLALSAEVGVRDAPHSRAQRFRWALSSLERLLVYRHIYYFTNPIGDWSENLPSLRRSQGGAHGSAGVAS